MKKTATLPQWLIQTAVAVVLTALTGFLGSPFLRVMRQSQGPLRYWITGIILVLSFWFLGASALAVFLGSVWMTLGAYSEFEAKGFGWRTSGLISLILGTITGATGALSALRRAGIMNWDQFVNLIRDLVTGLLQQLNPGAKPDAALLAQQTPSVLIIFLVLALGTGLIFERRLFKWFNLPRERVASHLKLLEFRLPDWMIWIALSGFALTVVDVGAKELAIFGANVVNVTAVLYFFQGLAVLEVILNVLKVSYLMRVLVYFLLVGQMFFLLSLVGLIDYWVDFRRRIRKKPRPEESIQD
ncbi:MAG: DUF2232 domain-containing protein [Bdellovibrionaceae bacterium]|nr:DUF2232 domain-containing protein [Pseudobdellovibrionaceae bacterium]